MTEEDQLRAWRHPLPNFFHEFLSRSHRQRDPLADDAYPGFIAHEIPGPVTSSVFVVSGQDLIPRLKIEGSGDDVDAMSSVGNEDQIIRWRAEVFSQRLARLLV